VQNSGRDSIDQFKSIVYKIDKSNPDFEKSLKRLPKWVRKEVTRVEEQILLINPFPRPWPNHKLITEIRYQFRDNYETRVADKFRYVYRVQGTIIYAHYVERRGNKTYGKSLNV
jgi:hypothetical protein